MPSGAVLSVLTAVMGTSEVLVSEAAFIGWLVLAPVLLCATYAAYRDLFIGPPEELS